MLDLRLDFGGVGFPGFFEQAQLHVRQRFALCALANTAQVRQFQSECLVPGFQEFELVLCLRQQYLNQIRYLDFGIRRQVELIQLCERSNIFCTIIDKPSIPRRISTGSAISQSCPKCAISPGI